MTLADFQASFDDEVDDTGRRCRDEVARAQAAGPLAARTPPPTRASAPHARTSTTRASRSTAPAAAGQRARTSPRDRCPPPAPPAATRAPPAIRRRRTAARAGRLRRRSTARPPGRLPDDHAELRGDITGGVPEEPVVRGERHRRGARDESMAHVELHASSREVVLTANWTEQVVHRGRDAERVVPGALRRHRVVHRRCHRLRRQHAHRIQDSHGHEVPDRMARRHGSGHEVSRRAALPGLSGGPATRDLQEPAALRASTQDFPKCRVGRCERQIRAATTST